MSSSGKPPPRTPFKSSTSASAPSPAFLQQRDALVGEISIVRLSLLSLIRHSTAMEQVLQNINKLNRSLEGVIAVGNEFGAVEALWSQFENVMAKEPGEGDVGKEEGLEGEDQESDKEAVEGATEDAKEAEGRK
ncbi:MAG: hypothetical protein Q9203_000787 [Teloschistes exilis]